MSKYEKIGGGSYGVYKKKSGWGAIVFWSIFGLMLLGVLSNL